MEPVDSEDLVEGNSNVELLLEAQEPLVINPMEDPFLNIRAVTPLGAAPTGLAQQCPRGDFHSPPPRDSHSECNDPEILDKSVSAEYTEILSDIKERKRKQRRNKDQA